MKLTHTLEDEITLLDRFKINPTELMFIKTLLILQNEEDENLFKCYIDVLHECNESIRNIILSLQSKEIILKSYNTPNIGEKFDPYSIPINKNFIKHLYRSSYEMGKELFEAYPQFGNINGKLVGLRSVSKKFDTLEDFYRFYGKSISWNQERHQKILDLLAWQSEYQLLTCTLANFIIDNKYLELESLQNGNTGNINLDAIKLV